MYVDVSIFAFDDFKQLQDSTMFLQSSAQYLYKDCLIDLDR